MQILSIVDFFVFIFPQSQTPQIHLSPFPSFHCKYYLMRVHGIETDHTIDTGGMNNFNL